MQEGVLRMRYEVFLRYILPSWSWDRVRKCSLSRSSRPKLALRLSTCPFCHGDPGRVYWGVICCFFSHVWISSLRNSGPLSLLRYLGVLPVHSCVWCKAQMTCDERNLLPACKQRHSRLYSSHTTNIRAILPSIVRSCLKS